MSTPIPLNGGFAIILNKQGLPGAPGPSAFGGIGWSVPTLTSPPLSSAFQLYYPTLWQNFSVNTSAAVAKAHGVSTGTVVITMRDAASGLLLATITFSPSSPIGVIVWAITALTIGMDPYLQFPTTPDATLANFTLSCPAL